MREIEEENKQLKVKVKELEDRIAKAIHQIWTYPFLNDEDYDLTVLEILEGDEKDGRKKICN